MPIRQTWLIALTLCVLAGSVAAAPASTAEIPTDGALTVAITRMDTSLFDAYNHCDLATMAAEVSPGLEFYHDKTGLMVGRDRFIATIRDNICGKLRRELIPGSIEVYPLKNFGAVQMGAHRFCDVKTNNCDAVARFVHLWQYADGKWTLTRVISYDHHVGT